jgi:uncharacterized membrane protein YdjX (TVP38/TMEM64 family)
MYRLPTWLRGALLAVIVLGVAGSIVLELTTDARMIHDFVDDFGPLVPAVFVVAHVAASLVFVPRSVMAVVASMLFGFWPACLWAIVGSMAGAIAGFVVARYINAGLIVPENLARVGPVLQRAEDGGWRAVALVRLLPVLPHALANYVLGLTRLSLGEYTLGSFIGMLPETYVFVNLAFSGRQAMGNGTWIEPLLWGLAFLAVSIVVPKLLRRFAR